MEFSGLLQAASAIIQQQQQLIQDWRDHGVALLQYSTTALTTLCFIIVLNHFPHPKNDDVGLRHIYISCMVYSRTGACPITGFTTSRACLPYYSHLSKLPIGEELEVACD